MRCRASTIRRRSFEIKLILEAADAETIAAARALDLPGNVEILVVPDLHPRTKPKALNYALPLARGDYLVIYDAEDRPERDQLRKGIAAFRQGPPNLACVQAKLNLYNADDNWLTRQFTIEYGALFDGLLPALDRLRLPIPLGGTSNHFRVAALKWLMAWDPFNVTEDADLGTRLARSGYRCQVLSSTTFEEAPVRFASWLRQRTRWIKGYMQTWLVHMRQPAKLWRELGPAGFLGFQVMVGGTVLSALVHPWFYALAAFDLANHAFLAQPGAAWAPALARRLAQSWGGLSCLDGGRVPGGQAARHPPALQASAADAALLAADLRRSLPCDLAVHDQPLRLGEDRAWGLSQHGEAAPL